MLQFLTLAWNVEEKAFGLLGEPTRRSPRPVCQRSQTQNGESSYLALEEPAAGLGACRGTRRVSSPHVGRAQL